jgi:16S rRNA (uracil1498-N3)-methyltransferase
VARERRRLLIASQRLQAAAEADGPLPQLLLTVEESHYASRVLRLRDGQELAIVNGQGQLWTARLDGGDRRQRLLTLLQPIDQPAASEAPPLAAITLAIALPKRDSDLLLRMACELGVDRLQPLIADHSVTGERFQRQRLEAILREATEQCERLWVPVLADPIPADSWLARAPDGLGLLATTRRHELPGLLALLEAEVDRQQDLELAIGPEGGWSEREESLAEANGWRGVSLGGTILRSSTAAVAGIALLTHWRDH